MTSTIDSIIRIQIFQKEDVVTTLDRFKKTQDVPYSAIDFREIGETELELTIKYSPEIFDGTITQFIAILYGELPYMRGLGKLSFTGLRLPESAYQWFCGPQFGVKGIRSRWKLEVFPFLMCILKPSIDFSITTATQKNKVLEPLSGGFHAVKDDEIVGDMPHLTLSDRLELADQCPGYVPVINQDDFESYRTSLQKWKPKMVMVNASIIGFPMLNRLSRISPSPILSHLALQGTYGHSFSPWLYAFLHRLFGCDAFITAIGDSGYYCATKEEEKEMVDALTSPLPIRRTLPILAGGARIHNLLEIIAPYERDKTPYGLVFGSLFFYENESPASVAAKVLRTINDIKTDLH